jgi:transcriptional regulator with XRE-family HTH domain
MKYHLRSWRDVRGLSLETVAAALKKAHTTVSRWERGDVPIAVENLEKLAEVYGVTLRQLEFPPDAAALVAFMDQAQHIIADLDRERLEQWLAIGESLRRPK